MQRRKVLAIAGTGLAAGAAGCLSSAQTDEEPTATREPTTISVSGNGEVTTEPTIARLSVGVTETGTDASAIGERLAERSQQLYQTLRNAGIAADDITTTHYQIREDSRDSTIRGRYEYGITIREIDRVGEVIDIALDAGTDNIGRVTYTIDEQTRDELRETAIEQAIDDAEATADIIAAENDLVVDRPKNITTQNAHVGPLRVNYAEALDDAAAGGTVIENDDVSVTATVEISYYVE